jgi:endoglycosylceramidase
MSLIKKITLVIILFTVFISCKKDDNRIFPTEWLYAEIGDNAGIYDQLGRRVLLRGTNYNVLTDYWAANEAVATVKFYDKNDFKEMAYYGFNSVRLLFSWSELEPTRGNYNQDYINQIKQAIEDAAEYGLYIIIDMHQDAYSKYIFTPQTGEEVCESPQKGWDGAPLWAVITEGAPTCNRGSRESSPAVAKAWNNLWKNTDGIADACIDAWKELVRQTCQYSNVAGYDLFNEPSLGNDEYAIEVKRYSRFLSKLITAIRQVEQESGGYEHIVFFENTVTWNNEELPAIPELGFSKDQNIVFSGHNYFGSISQIFTIEQGFELFENLRKLFKTTFYGGEWGFFGDPAARINDLKRYTTLEDRYFWSGDYWGWAEAPGDPHVISWDGLTYPEKHLHLIEVDKNGIYTGVKKDIFLDVLSRTRPKAIAGKPLSLKSNPDDGTMTLKARAGDKTEITNLWIPDRFGSPTISGKNIGKTELTKVEGGYLADVEVSGSYELTVSF